MLEGSADTADAKLVSGWAAGTGRAASKALQGLADRDRDSGTLGFAIVLVTLLSSIGFSTESKKCGTLDGFTSAEK